MDSGLSNFSKTSDELIIQIEDKGYQAIIMKDGLVMACKHLATRQQVTDWANALNELADQNLYVKLKAHAYYELPALLEMAMVLFKQGVTVGIDKLLLVCRTGTKGIQ